MEQTTKTESQKLGEQILESLRKQGVPIPGEPKNSPDFVKIFEEAFKQKWNFYGNGIIIIFYTLFFYRSAN